MHPALFSMSMLSIQRSQQCAPCQLLTARHTTSTCGSTARIRRRGHARASTRQGGTDNSPSWSPLNGPTEKLLTALVPAMVNSQTRLLTDLSASLCTAISRIQKSLQPLPPGLPRGPQADAALDMAADPLAFLEATYEQYGPVAAFRLLGEPILLVADPSLAKQVLVTQSDVFVKAGTAFFPGSSLAGNGLLVSDGEVWRRQRRLANPAFRQAAVSSYAQAMVQLTDDMVASEWGEGGVRDVYEEFNKLTLDIVVASLFGYSNSSTQPNKQQTVQQHSSGAVSSRGSGSGGSSGSRNSSSSSNGSSRSSSADSDLLEVGEAISVAFDFFARRATSMLFIPEWVPTPDNIQYLSAVDRLDRVVFRIISARRQLLAGNLGTLPDSQQTTLPQDLLQRLLEARDDDGSGMDDQALRDELMTLLVAGQETSAILLTWVCVMLALHPEEQRKAAEEVQRVVGEGRCPERKDLAQLKHVDAIIWETLRLMPPAFMVGRCANRDTQLGQWQVQRGTTVLVSPYLLQRAPDTWTRPSEFVPARWLPDGGAAAQAENDSFWPFGGGPRNCIGMGFALMETSLVISRMLQSFELSLPPGQPQPRPQAMITLRPAGKVNLVLTKRH